MILNDLCYKKQNTLNTSKILALFWYMRYNLQVNTLNTSNLKIVGKLCIFMRLIGRIILKQIDEYQEVEDLERDIEIVEEFVDISDSLIELEQNRDLIRLEMNIVEYPIFSKNKNIKQNQVRKYYFNSEKTSFLEVRPAFNSSIPGDFEERIFISLTKIMRDRGYSQTFYTNISEILDNLNVPRTTKNGLYKKTKESIDKMANSTYRFKNLFYSNEISKIVDDLINTNMFTYRVITFKEANNNESEFFMDKRVREVYKITFTDEFYKNIIAKGYLAFDAEELLNIKDSITRSIFTMITKWRKNELELRKPAYFIARRIPLAWKNVSRAIKTIENSCIYLKNNNFILDYKIEKSGKIDTTEFVFYFDEMHNKIKQKNFYDEKSSFDRYITHEEHDEITQSGDLLTVLNSEKYEKIMDIVPEKLKKLTTFSKEVKKALAQYEYTYVKYTLEYTLQYSKTSSLKYFKDALKNNWADEYIAKKQSKIQKNLKKEETIEEAVVIEKPNYGNWDEIEKLESKVQKELEEKAYKNFLEEANSSDSRIMRSIFEKSKKSLILKEYAKNDFVKTVETSKVYPSLSAFILECLNYFKINNFPMDSENFMKMFSFMRVYEDDIVLMKYNEETKLGEIIKKI